MVEKEISEMVVVGLHVPDCRKLSCFNAKSIFHGKLGTGLPPNFSIIPFDLSSHSPKNYDSSQVLSSE